MTTSSSRRVKPLAERMRGVLVLIALLMREYAVILIERVYMKQIYP